MSIFYYIIVIHLNILMEMKYRTESLEFNPRLYSLGGWLSWRYIPYAKAVMGVLH